VIVIPDFNVLMLIAAKPPATKTVHHWPAGVAADGNLCRPKMKVGATHVVYEHAPQGRFGNKYEPPMIFVMIDGIGHDCPFDWQEEDMPAEGFESVEAYGRWWDRWRAGDRLCKPWAEMQDEPFWFCTFHMTGFTHFFERKCQLWDEARKKQLKALEKL
jgi:hypothetical protein